MSTATMSTREVMTSLALISSKSSAACSSSLRSSSSTSSSSAVSMMLCSSSTAASPSSSASSPRSGAVSRWTRETTSQVRGFSTTLSARTAGATASERRFAFFLATILGIVSPKTMTSSVITAVAIQVLLSLPKRSTMSTDESDEAAILTRLLPIRIALRVSSKCSTILSAMPARLSPPSRRLSRRTVLQEE